MLEVLAQFAALSLVSGLMLTLLPEGSIRRTASMAVGLLLLLFWMESLHDVVASLTALPDLSTPSTVLTSTGVSLLQAEEDALSALAPEMEASP